MKILFSVLEIEMFIIKMYQQIINYDMIIIQFILTFYFAFETLDNI